jgi:hypothetical protein
VALPETGHVIREAHKYDMVESMLGFGLSPDARKNIHIKSNIVSENSPPTKSQKQAGNTSTIVKKSPTHSKVDAVETILGYAIPPSRHSEIHTEGLAQVKVESGKDTAEIERLAEQLQSLKNSNDLLREEL